MESTDPSTTQIHAPETVPMTIEGLADSSCTSIWWLSGAGFLINARGTLILIDPVIMMLPDSEDTCENGMRLIVPLPLRAADLPRPDAVLYTHTDGDHLAPLSAQALASSGADFYGTAAAIRELEHLSIPEKQTRAYQIGETFRIGNVRITLTSADHAWQVLDPERYGTPFGPEDCCGFLLDTPDGSIWCPGDTRLMPEHLQMESVDVLLLDVSDDPYHFGYKNAGRLANRYAGADVIAHHYGTYEAPDALPFNGDPAKLAAEIEGAGRRFHVLAPGERYELWKGCV